MRGVSGVIVNDDFGFQDPIFVPELLPPIVLRLITAEVLRSCVASDESST